MNKKLSETFIEPALTAAIAVSAVSVADRDVWVDRAPIINGLPINVPPAVSFGLLAFGGSLAGEFVFQWLLTKSQARDTARAALKPLSTGAATALGSAVLLPDNFAISVKFGALAGLSEIPATYLYDNFINPYIK